MTAKSPIVLRSGFFENRGTDAFIVPENLVDRSSQNSTIEWNLITAVTIGSQTWTLYAQRAISEKPQMQLPQGPRLVE